VPATDNGISGSTEAAAASSSSGTAGPAPVAAGLTTVPASSIFSGSVPIHEEYDPMRPNEYEEVMRERERRKKAAEAEAEKQARLKEMEEVMERLKQQEDGPSGSGALPPPPSRTTALDISGEEAFLRRGRLKPGAGGAAGPAGVAAPAGGGGGAGPGGPAPGSDDGAKGMSLAQKMLEKMGWKEGEGLGKHRQGMSTPLVAQKTDKRAGVIVNAEAAAGSRTRPGGEAEPADKKARVGSALQGKPSKVICLRNMVGPGEVDPDLEDEVGNELTKYGNVTSVMIFEITEPSYPPEEAVRIFVQFDRVESATKAQIDLQGRYFGGRNVRVAFFSEERFDRLDLAPSAGEFD